MSPALEAHEDAYGQAILDHLNGRETWEIVERDDGSFSPGAGPKLYYSEYDQWRQMERDAMEHVRGRVLDVGCGAGRFMLYLSEQGHDVTGIDNSPGAIEACRRRGLDDTHVLGIEDLDLSLGTFDTVLLLGGNLGLLGNPDTGRSLLRTLHEITSPQGRIIGASRDRRHTKDADMKTYVERNLELGRLSGQSRIRIRYRKYATPFFDFFRIAPDELDELLRGTGWATTKVIWEDDTSYVAVLDKAP
jgi:SAM-dependent methyltransferase